MALYNLLKKVIHKLGLAVRTDVQYLSDAQKEQARKNIGVAQADYAQNDSEAPDYIKNRIAWTEPTQTYILPETTITITDGAYRFESAIELQDGKNYIVNWNGVKYDCQCTLFNTSEISVFLLGNHSILGVGTDTGEPFLFTISSDGGSEVGAMVENGDYTVSITGVVESVHKIDKKFLPETTWDTLGVETEEIFNETLSGFSSSADGSPKGYIFRTPAQFSLIEGQEYEIIWDGVSYTTICESEAASDGISYYIGERFVNYHHGKFPFIVDYKINHAGIGSLNRFIACDVDGTVDTEIDAHSVIIRKRNINKIPTEYYERLAWVDYAKTEVFPETTITIVDEEYIQEGMIGLQDGCSYVVNWNGTEYECKGVSVNNGGAIVIGNLSFGEGSGSNDTGEPFAIVDMLNDNMSAFGTPFGDGDYTVSISVLTEDVHKVDKKFLPELTWDSIGLEQDEIFNDTVTGFAKHNGMTMIQPSPFQLVVGQKYEVVWDGISYIDVCYDSNILGNYNSHDYRGYPFYIRTVDNTGYFYAIRDGGAGYDSSVDSHTVIIRTQDINKIPTEYYDQLGWVEYTRVEMIPETTVSVENGEAGMDCSEGLVSGTRYIVGFNGEEYNCVCSEIVVEDIPVCCLGNLSIMGEYNNTGEPFCVAGWSIMDLHIVMFVTNMGDGDYTISLTRLDEVVHQIDNKFLPKVTPDDLFVENNVILDKTLFGFDRVGAIQLENATLGLKEGTQYTVKFDGVDYDVVCYNSNAIFNGLTIGNSCWNSDGIWSKEPFIIQDDDGATTIYAVDVENQSAFDRSKNAHSVVITEHKINQLDQKYVPYIQPDYSQNDETAPDHVKNRTHWVEYETHTITFDGDITGKTTVPGTLLGYPDTCVYVKVLDRAITESEIESVRVMLNDAPGILYGKDGKGRLSFENNTLGDANILTCHGHDDGGDEGIFVISLSKSTDYNGYSVEQGTYVRLIESSGTRLFTSEVNVVFESAVPLDEKFIPDSIPKVESASVGQTLVVKAVDENGKPTEWEAANVGGGLPVVDLETVINNTDGEPVALSEDDCRKLNEVVTRKTPIILNVLVDTYPCSLVCSYSRFFGLDTYSVVMTVGLIPLVVQLSNEDDKWLVVVSNGSDTSSASS